MAPRSSLLLLALVFHSGVVLSEGPASAPVAAPRPSAMVMPPMVPTPASPETPEGPSLAPDASNDCMTLLLDNLFSCLGYVEEDGNITKPDKDCCSGLKTVVDTNPICLCQLVTSNNTYGFAVNRTKSLMLPTVCRVQTPPISLCSVIAGAPLSSPAASPSGASPAPMGPTLPAEPTSTVAAPPLGGNADARLGCSVPVLVVGLVLATVAMF